LVAVVDAVGDAEVDDDVMRELPSVRVTRPRDERALEKECTSFTARRRKKS
jgi:hypothetical protein